MQIVKTQSQRIFWFLNDDFLEPYKVNIRNWYAQEKTVLRA